MTSSYEVVQEDDTDVLFGNPFEGEDLEEGLDDRGAFSGISKGGDEGLKPMSLEYVYFFLLTNVFSLMCDVTHTHTKTTLQILVQFRKSREKFDRDEETKEQNHVHGGVGRNLRIVGVVVLHRNG